MDSSYSTYIDQIRPNRPDRLPLSKVLTFASVIPLSSVVTVLLVLISQYGRTFLDRPGRFHNYCSRGHGWGRVCNGGACIKRTATFRA
ncbi:hypothetical protein FIBSPDRAFT_856213 [Athelia psychrophila]|uniref:Uncharacterized protein n=1 Tax=Athelia psychrophila TaxID=1759441 RepID=A0A166NP87_9AGAM|nr:hypothetical protein FIBSPDRAFT_856213 [Fibularhizoctonia sp. CBS 109695]